MGERDGQQAGALKGFRIVPRHGLKSGSSGRCNRTLSEGQAAILVTAGTKIGSGCPVGGGSSVCVGAETCPGLAVAATARLGVPTTVGGDLHPRMRRGKGRRALLPRGAVAGVQGRVRRAGGCSEWRGGAT